MLRTSPRLLAVGVLMLLGACGAEESGDTDVQEAALVTTTIATASGEVAISLDPRGQTTGTPITIEAIVPADGARLSEDFVAAFRLLPAGTTFDTPVTLAITLAGPPEGALSGLHSSEDRPVEVLEFLPVAYDPDADATTYEAEVTHFSEVQVERYGEEVETRILPPIPGDRYLVGQSFTMSVRVIPTSVPSRDRGLYQGTDARLVSDKGGPITFNASWHTTGAPLGIDFSEVVSFQWLTRESEFAASPLEPASAEGRPPTQVVTERQPLTFQQKFTCISPGRFFVWFNGNQHQPGVLTEFRGTTVVRREAIDRWAYARAAITGECVAPSAGTSTPTPGVALPTTAVAPSATALTTGAVPTVIIPSEPRVPTPVTGTGDLPGFIKVFAYDGTWYDASTLTVTPAHEPFCSYEHLHGGPVQSILPGPGGQPTTITEMYGECGYGPSGALFWIEDPR